MGTVRCAVAFLLVLCVSAAVRGVTVYEGNASVRLTDGTKYDLGQPGLWGIVTYDDVDVSNLIGPGAGTYPALNLDFGDHTSGSGWEKFHVQVHPNPGNTGKLLLQSYDKWFSALKSSHQFNAGVITGPIDVRVLLQQQMDDTWLVTPQYLVPSGSASVPSDGSIGGVDTWHTFFGGAFVSADSFDLTVAEAFAQLDPGSNHDTDSYAVIGGASIQVVPEPVTMAGLVMGIGALGGYIRRRRTA